MGEHRQTALGREALGREALGREGLGVIAKPRSYKPGDACGYIRKEGGIQIPEYHPPLSTRPANHVRSQFGLCRVIASDETMTLPG